ncbi:MAG: hypothetical protein ACREBG_18945 [Pyrinomonadaceae bacterium]
MNREDVKKRDKGCEGQQYPTHGGYREWKYDLVHKVNDPKYTHAPDDTVAKQRTLSSVAAGNDCRNASPEKQATEEKIDRE